MKRTPILMVGLDAFELGIAERLMIIWQGAVDVSAGRMSGGTIAAFVLYGGLLAGAFGALSEVYGDLLRAAGASERLDELLNAEPDIKAPARPRKMPDPPKGELAFEDVTFHYPTRRETSALEEFSLSVKPRERLALVGPSGAGKTTIFQLAERFYDPQRGRVLMDGIDLRDADPADIRQRIAMGRRIRYQGGASGGSPIGTRPRHRAGFTSLCTARGMVEAPARRRPVRHGRGGDQIWLLGPAAG